MQRHARPRSNPSSQPRLANSEIRVLQSNFTSAVYSFSATENSKTELRGVRGPFEWQTLSGGPSTRPECPCKRRQQKVKSAILMHRQRWFCLIKTKNTSPLAKNGQTRETYDKTGLWTPAPHGPFPHSRRLLFTPPKTSHLKAVPLSINTWLKHPTSLAESRCAELLSDDNRRASCREE